MAVSTQELEVWTMRCLSYFMTMLPQRKAGESSDPQLLQLHLLGCPRRWRTPESHAWAMGWPLSFFTSCLENTYLVTLVGSEFKDTACLTKCVAYARHLKWPQLAVSARPHAGLVTPGSSVACFLIFDQVSNTESLSLIFTLDFQFSWKMKKSYFCKMRGFSKVA